MNIQVFSHKCTTLFLDILGVFWCGFRSQSHHWQLRKSDSPCKGDSMSPKITERMEKWMEILSKGPWCLTSSCTALTETETQTMALQLWPPPWNSMTPYASVGEAWVCLFTDHLSPSTVSSSFLTAGPDKSPTCWLANRPQLHLFEERTTGLQTLQY